MGPKAERLTASDKIVATKDKILDGARDTLLNERLRWPRSLDIARTSQTTESTMFRYFASVESITKAVYDRSWQRVNKAIMDFSFVNSAPDASTRLQGEISILLDLTDDQDIRFAFAFRPFSRDINREQKSPQEERFNNHFLMLCKDIVAERSHPFEPESLASLITGLVTTNWPNIVDPEKKLSKEDVLSAINGIIAIEKTE